MSDLIKRQDAIDAVNQYGSVWMEYTDSMSREEVAEEALKASKRSMVKILLDLPSAEHHKLNIAEYIHDFYPDVWRHAEKELEVPYAQPEIIRCKDCSFDRDCTHTMTRKSRGGGIIYCPVEYCSEAERKDNG